MSSPAFLPAFDVSASLEVDAVGKLDTQVWILKLAELLSGECQLNLIYFFEFI